MALVRKQMPKDKNSFTTYSKEEPGGATLAEACLLLAKAGADLSKVSFVLSSEIKFWGDYDRRGTMILLSAEIFDKQDRMNVAVFSAYAEVEGNNWLAQQLIATAKEKAQ
jgi:hypothetical protein